MATTKEPPHRIDTHHNQDKTLKESMELFKGGSLDFLGIETSGSIEEILSGEITETTTKKAYADCVFRVTNNKGLHLEWESKVSNDDILRFLSYNVDLIRKHGMPFETVIVTVNKPTATAYENPYITFRPKVINLKDRDADVTLKRIEDRISKGEPVNLLEVVYLPLYGSESGKTTVDLLDTAIKLTPKVAKEDNQKREKLQSLILLLNSTFVSGEELKKILEANYMNLEGNRAVKVLKEMGISEGEERTKTETAREMLQDGVSVEKIAKYVKMPIEWVEGVQSTLLELAN